MRSNFEKTIRDQLKAAKVKWSYEKHTFEYTLKKKYKVDFFVDLKNGISYFIETKGRFTSADRTKLKKVKEEHPEIDLRILFMQDNWMTKTKSQRYSEWAKNNGFMWAVGDIPDAWLASKTSKRRPSIPKKRNRASKQTRKH